MTPDRVRAWQHELRVTHDRLREKLGKLRASIVSGRPRDEFSGDLRTFCLGFCSALRRHHTDEDNEVFPRVLTANPGLKPIVDKLAEDHVLLGYLLADLEAVPPDAPPAEVLRHLDGIAAIMESHFLFEERVLK